MRRVVSNVIEMPGQDSFLDIVANMVGILIILVMVVGVRAAQAPLNPPEDEKPAEENPLASVHSHAVSLEADVQRLGIQAAEVQSDVKLRRQQRDRLATMIAAMDEDLAERREKLSEKSQQDFDERRAHAEARNELAKLDLQKRTLDQTRPLKVKIQNLPTPLSKTVHSQEAHIQLIGGRLTYIPLDDLLQEFRSAARRKVWKLEGSSQMTDTVGPIDGFRLRYRLGRFDIPLEIQRETGRGGSVIQLIQWELQPVAPDLGEKIDIALSDGSRFRYALARVDRATTTITVWTYPDSFDEFRKLKAYLHSLGYPTACRPLPMGQSIGGSPEGSRSAAQ